MSRYIARRIVFLGLTILVTSLIIFIVTQLLPGDVARVVLGAPHVQQSVLTRDTTFI